MILATIASVQLWLSGGIFVVYHGVILLYKIICEVSPMRIEKSKLMERAPILQMFAMAHILRTPAHCGPLFRPVLQWLGLLDYEV